MKQTRVRCSLGGLVLLPLLVLSLLLLWQPLVSDARSSGIEAAWAHARQAGAYRFSADVVQQTIPQPIVTNVGRESREDALHIEGHTDLARPALEFTLWSQGGNLLNAADGIEVRIEDDHALARRGDDEWEEINDISALFAPDGDFLAYLVATRDVVEHEPETRSGVTFTRYTFRIDGPAFAAYMRDQMEGQLARSGELPSGMAMGLSETYTQMTGQGELWVGSDGLPLRQMLHLQLPDTEDETVTAEVDVTFSDFGPGNSNATSTIPRGLTQQIGLFLAAAVLVVGVVAYRRSRHLYTVVALAVVGSLVVTPILRGAQAAEFGARQADRAQRQEERARESEMSRALDGLRQEMNREPLTPSGPAALALMASDAGRDTDRDTMTDVEERFFGTDPRTADAALPQSIPASDDGTDRDRDGLTDYQEALLGTDPESYDSDGDLITDTLEIEGFSYAGRTWYTDPLQRDTNADGIDDGSEWLLNPTGQPPDTDGDGTPDLFDPDNDGDRVPDDLDISPYQDTRGTRTFGQANPFGLIVDGLEPGRPTYVDIQLRPVITDHLWYAFNVLDWPEDRQGQIQDDDGATFYDLDPDLDQVPNANGDVKLLPMLEIRITGSPTNLPLVPPRLDLTLQPQSAAGVTGTLHLDQQPDGLHVRVEQSTPNGGPVGLYTGSCQELGARIDVLGVLPSGDGTMTTTLTGPARQLPRIADGDHAFLVTDLGTGDPISCADVPRRHFDGAEMVDQETLAHYGIVVQDLQPNGAEKAVYVPLRLVTDAQGGSRVAFAGRMFYRAAATWGAAQEVRLVWVVQALVDECASYSLGDTDGDGVEDFSNDCQSYAAHNQVQIVHVYHDEWYLTGLKVREDHGTRTAFIYEDPDADTVDGLHDDSSLLTLASQLDPTFLAARNCDAVLPDGTCDARGGRDITVSTLYQRFNHADNDAVTAEERWNIPDVLAVVTRTYEHVDDFLLHATVTDTRSILESDFSAHWSATDPITPSILYAREEFFRAANLDGEGTAALSWNNANQLTVQMPTRRGAGGAVQVAAAVNVAPFHREDASAEWDECPIERYWLELARRYPFYDESDPEARDGKQLMIQIYYLTLYKGVERIVQVGERVLIDPIGTPDQPLAAKVVGFAGLGAKFIINQVIIGRLIGITPTAMGSFYKYVGALAREAGFKYLSTYGPKLMRLPTTLANQHRYLRWLGSRWGKGLIAGLAIVALVGLTVLTVKTMKGYVNQGLWARITLAVVVGAAAAVLMIVKPIITIVGWIRAIQAAGESWLVATRMTLFARSEVIGLSWKAGLIGLIIGLAVTWGIFIYYAVQMEPGSAEFNQLLAYTIASSIVAVLIFVISLTNVGAIISGLLMVIDAVLMILGLDFTITTWITEKLAAAFYDLQSILTVDTDVGPFQPSLVHEEQGLQAGNLIDVRTTITTTAVFTDPEDASILLYLHRFYNEDNLASTTISHTLDTGANPVTPTRDLRTNDWTIVLDHEYGFFKKDMYRGWLVDFPNLRYPLTAGRNRVLPLTLNTNYALPAVSRSIIPVLPVPIYVDQTIAGSVATDLGQSVVVDVFPTTLDAFYETRWIERNNLDVDGDGLRGAAHQGNDPDDFDPDVDDDGLADGFEVAMRSHPFEEGGAHISAQARDTDADGMCDADELRHGTDPGHVDTDRDGLWDSAEVFHRDCATSQWTGGWTSTMSYTDDQGTPRTLEVFITTDPLSPDEDDDGLSDLTEKSLGLPYHPRAWNATPLVVTTDVGDADGFVARDQTFAYTATVHSQVITPLFSLGLVSVTLPGALGSHVLTDSFNIFSGEEHAFRTPLTVTTGAAAGPVVIENQAFARLHLDQTLETTWGWQGISTTVQQETATDPAYTALASAGDAEFAVAVAEVGDGRWEDDVGEVFYDNGKVDLYRALGTFSPPARLGPVTREPDIPDTKLGDTPPGVACNDAEQCIGVWIDDDFEPVTDYTMEWIGVDETYDSPYGNNWAELLILYDYFPVWSGDLDADTSPESTWTCGDQTRQYGPDSAADIRVTRLLDYENQPAIYETDANDDLDKLFSQIGYWAEIPGYSLARFEYERTEIYEEHILAFLCSRVDPNYGYEVRVAGDQIASSVPLYYHSERVAHPAIASDGQDFLVVWQQQRSNIGIFSSIAARHVAADGTLSSDPLILDGGSDLDNTRPAVAWAGDRYIVVWERGNYLGDNDLVMAYVSPDGQTVDGPYVVANTGGEETHAGVAYAPELDRSLVVYIEVPQLGPPRVASRLIDGIHVGPPNAIREISVDLAGEAQYAAVPFQLTYVPLDPVNGDWIDYEEPHGAWLAAWLDYDPLHYTQLRIYYHALRADGTPLDLAGGPIAPAGEPAFTVDVDCLDSHTGGGRGDCALVTATRDPGPDLISGTVHLTRLYPGFQPPWRGALAPDPVMATVTVDTDLPTAIFAGLSDGQTLNPTGAYLMVGGYADDATSGVAQVEIRTDGDDWHTVDETSGAWITAWHVEPLADGDHTLSVRAIDAVGNVGPATTFTIRLDRAAPTVTADQAGATIGATAGTGGRWHLALSGTATDTGSPLDTVAAAIVPHGTGWQTATLAAGSWSLDYALTPAVADPTGPYTLTLRAADRAGNLTPPAEYVRVSLYVDATPPVARVTATGPATDTITQTLTVSGVVTDPGPVAAGVGALEIGFTRGGEDPGDWTPATVGSPGAVTSGWSHPVPPGLEGSYAIDLRATDSLGNRNDDAGTWRQWQGQIDTAPPRAAITVTLRGAGEAAQTHYQGWAEDGHLVTTGFQFPCPLQRSDDHFDTGWLEETSGTPTHLVRLTPECTLPGWPATAPTLRACDAYDHCTVVTGTLPLHPLPIASAVLTPAHEAAMASAAPVSLTVGAYAVDALQAITVTANGALIDATSWATASVTDTHWQTTWDPPGEGRYRLVSQAADWSGRVQTATQPITVVVDAQPPHVTLPTLVITTAHQHTSTQVILTGVATDSVGLAAVDVSIDGGPWDAAWFDGATWRAAWYPGPSPDPVTPTISVRATDLAGHTDQATRIVPCDLVPPQPVTVTLSYTGTVDSGPLAAGDTVYESSATLNIDWTPSSDGSGGVTYRAGWTADPEPDPAALTPTAGLHHQAIVSGPTARYAHLVVLDAYGNRWTQTLGPVFVDAPTTADWIEDLDYHGWMGSGCADLSADREIAHNAHTGAALRHVQRLYAGWNASALRLAWTGANWDGDGDLFIYLDTGAGGATTAYDPFGQGPTIDLPVGLSADYLVWVQDAGTAQLLRWSGGWTVDTALDGAHYRLDTEPAAPRTDLLLPWAWLGAPSDLRLVALASEEGTLRIWATAPDKNPLNSERVVDAVAVEHVGEDFALTQHQTFASLGAGVCPNGGHGADADLTVRLTSDPPGVEAGFLAHDLPSRLTPGMRLDGDLDGDPDPALPLPLDGTPVLIGDGQTVTYTLHYTRAGSILPPGATVTVTAYGPLALAGGSPLVVTVPATRTGSIDVTATVNASPGDRSAEVTAVVADAAHGAFDWQWIQHDVDTAAPISLTITAPVQYIRPATNTVRGTVEDPAGVPQIDLEVRPSVNPGDVTSISCPDETPTDGQWSCTWNVGSAANGAGYQLRARATDRFGNQGDWTAWHDVTVDANAPTWIALSPETEDAFSDGLLVPDELVLSGTVTDDDQAVAAEACVRMDGASDDVCIEAPAAPGTAPTGSWYARAPILGTGDGVWQTFRFHGIDGAGNRSGALVTRTARIDVQAPAVTVTTAADVLLLSDVAQIALAGEVDDGTGVDRVDVYVAYPDRTVVSETVTTAAGAWSYSAVFDQLGEVTLRIVARDDAGNVGHTGPFDLLVYAGTDVSDLAVDQWAWTDLVITGQPLTYTLVVTNNGPDAAAGVVLHDRLPPRTSLLSIGSPDMSCGGTDDVVTCTLTSLAAGHGAEATLRVHVPLTTTGKVRNVVSATVTTLDMEPANDRVERYTSVLQPVTGLAVRNDSPAPLGQTTTLTATIDSGTQVRYTWDFGDGSPISVTLSPTGTAGVARHRYDVGQFTATVTASNIYNQATAQTTITLDIPVGSLLLDEDFEQDPQPPFWSIAPGWQMFAYRDFHDDYKWEYVSDPTYVHSGDRAAFHDDRPYGLESWLVTPRLTPAANSQLIFWQYPRYPDHYEHHGVWISTGSPDPKDNDYELLAEVGSGTENVWEEVRLDLAAYAGQPIYVAFRYAGTYASEWAVDDVRVTADLMATNDSPTPLGQATTLTATLGSGSNVRTVWDFADGTPPLDVDLGVVTHVYPAAGVYTTVLTAYNSVGAVTTTTPVVIEPVMEHVYLPLVMRDHGLPPAPDLVVKAVEAAAGEVAVAIANRGTAPVTADSSFWVDLYINPTVTPTRVNQTWDVVGEWGGVWGVPTTTLPLAPGGVLTLTVGGAHYWPTLSRVPASIPADWPLFAQVDSAGDAAYGAILEGHEDNGGVYNNVLGPVYGAPDEMSIAAASDVLVDPLPDRARVTPDAMPTYLDYWRRTRGPETESGPRRTAD